MSVRSKEFIMQRTVKVGGIPSSNWNINMSTNTVQLGTVTVRHFELIYSFIFWFWIHVWTNNMKRWVSIVCPYFIFCSEFFIIFFIKCAKKDFFECKWQFMMIYTCCSIAASSVICSPLYADVIWLPVEPKRSLDCRFALVYASICGFVLLPAGVGSAEVITIAVGFVYPLHSQ